MWDLMTLQDSINSSTTDVEIRHLQLVSRESMSTIKSGEEEKTKTYSALCEASTEITDADLAVLNSFKSDLKVQVFVRVVIASVPGMFPYMLWGFVNIVLFPSFTTNYYLERKKKKRGGTLVVEFGMVQRGNRTNFLLDWVVATIVRDS